MKRWDSERSLPVHRLPGGGRGSVYALAAELDAWLTSGSAIEGDEEEASTPEFVEEAEEIPVAPAFVNESAPPSLAGAAAARPSLRRKWALPLAVLFLVGIAGAAVQLAMSRHGDPWISTTVSSLTAKSEPKTNPTASPALSDSEKRLAHELYLKGLYEWNQRSPDSLNRALDDFTQSAVHDPNDAESYLGLADTYGA